MRKATWYWKIWWWVGYNCFLYKINWFWQKLMRGGAYNDRISR